MSTGKMPVVLTAGTAVLLGPQTRGIAFGNPLMGETPMLLTGRMPVLRLSVAKVADYAIFWALEIQGPLGELP